MHNNDNQLDDFFGLKPEYPDQKPKETIKDVLVKKLGFRAKLRLLPKILSQRERYIIGGLLIVIVGSLLAIPFTSFYHFTTAKADYGGSFTEGILGEPRFVNPLLSQTNDPDRDLVSLVYSGMMKYDENGKLVPDLAKSYEVSSDGLTYTIYLKENAYWHDGPKVTADDVIFTIQTAQNPDYVSSQRVSWQGVELEKVNDYAVMFKLKNKYAQFLNTFTMGIMPKHIWQDVKPINFTLSEFNLKPLGSGHYKFAKLKKDQLGRIDSYELEAHEQHHDGRPYIERIVIKFYGSEDEMIDAYNKNQVENIGFVSAPNTTKIKYKNRISLKQLKLPRYFAVFFNQNQSKVLSDKNVRLGITHATDRQKLISEILGEQGILIHSPMIGGILDINESVKVYDYNQDIAKDALKTAGWANLDEQGILTKGTAKLSLKITTSTWPELVQVANMLKDQWKAVGIDATVEALPVVQLQQVIKDRQYEILLFGEILNMDPDPFSLWHSSQKRDPGLNLALYDNKTADTLLEQARQTLNPLERMKLYDDFQKLIIDDVPALFLYSPYYLYGQTNDIKGSLTTTISMPSDRFANIHTWYINTERSFK